MNTLHKITSILWCNEQNCPKVMLEAHSHYLNRELARSSIFLLPKGGAAPKLHFPWVKKFLPFSRVNLIISWAQTFQVLKNKHSWSIPKLLAPQIQIVLYQAAYVFLQWLGCFLKLVLQRDRPIAKWGASLHWNVDPKCMSSKLRPQHALCEIML